MSRNLTHWQTEMRQTQTALIDYLFQNQLPSGEFLSQFRLTLEGNVWTPFSQSPFITANILYAIKDANLPQAQEILRKGLRFLQSQMELGGFWRFWQHSPSVNCVPLDADDTALCAYLLTQYGGKKLNNRWALYLNQNAQGGFYTWFLPRPQLAVAPRLMYKAMEDHYAVLQTVEKNMLADNDVEPAVSAHALMYLGENAWTQRNIRQIINEIQTRPALTLQFYEHELFVYYHLARALQAGCNSLQVLQPRLEAAAQCWLANGEIEGNILREAVLLKTLLTFRCTVNDVLRLWPEKWIEEKIALQTIPILPYFTAKSREFFGGSAQLTAALVVDALSAYSQTLKTTKP